MSLFGDDFYDYYPYGYEEPSWEPDWLGLDQVDLRYKDEPDIYDYEDELDLPEPPLLPLELSPTHEPMQRLRERYWHWKHGWNTKYKSKK